jgi:CRP-like cAMP-binding protein
LAGHGFTLCAGVGHPTNTDGLGLSAEQLAALRCVDEGSDMAANQLDELCDALTNTELFREMDRKEVKAIARQAKVVERKAGDVITTEGRAGAGFHLLLDGVAAVETHRGEVELKPGAYFGEISLIDGLPRTATVRAVSDLRTAVLAPWDFMPLLNEHPKMAIGLLRGLCARLRSTDSVPNPR